MFSQGERCESVFFLSEGRVQISVINELGRDAVVAMLESGDFFGEGCLAGQPLRISSAVAATNCSIIQVGKAEMLSLLREEPAVAERFIAHMLARNIRIEADLVHQLFNNTEKRLARALLLLARYGKTGATTTEIPKVSQQTLADMVGTTRSRVNFFMRKFQRHGFIDYNGTLTVNHSLVTVVLHE